MTGFGKTFTMANVIQALNKPTLVLAHTSKMADLKFDLFGEVFSLPAILGIFDCHIASIEKKKKKTKLIFADETDGKKAYTSVLCFANNEEMENFKETVTENYMKKLSDAKLPQEYLNI